MMLGCQPNQQIIKPSILFTEMLNGCFSCIDLFWVKIGDFPKVLDSPVTIE